jgi:putative ABC transport system permease protein
MTSLLRDVRYGARILVSNRGFAAAALAVLALGVGSSTAVFSVLRGVMLTPLPYREPGRLVLFRVDLPGYAHQPALTSQEYFSLRDRTDLFESVSIVNPTDVSLTDPATMLTAPAASIGDGFFETLGVAPALGRTVSRRDISRGIQAVVLGDEIWRRRFNGDPAIVGRRIEIDDQMVTVAGVMPPGFRLHLGPGVLVSPRVDVWLPRVKGYDDDPFRGQVVVARLRPDVTLEAARAETAALGARLSADHPALYRTGAVRLSIAPVDEEVVSDVKPSLVAIAGAVGFVLLVACANLANLLLARASARGRELAVRAAIGASAARIRRQLAAEGLLIGGLGAMGGIVVAAWGVAALARLAPAALPRREAIDLDAASVAFAIVVSLACAVGVSLVPAWQAAGRDQFGRLRRESSPSKGAATMRGLLVAGQIALSLMLLAGAGLMGRAFVGLRGVPLGFDPRQVAVMTVTPPERFATLPIEEARAARLAFYQRLSVSLRQLPGVERLGIGLPAPFSPDGTMAQRYALGPAEPERQAEGVIALEGFLETLRVPLVAGRYFTAADGRQPVVIVDRRLAAELWPGEPAVGKRLLMAPSSRPQWVDVIGVVEHLQTQELRRAGLPQIWLTYATRAYGQLTIAVRAGDPPAAVRAIEREIQRAGVARPLRDIRLLADSVAGASADTRFALFVLGAFAVLAVTLTAIGVYGVVAYATARRAREIAVRLALGADARGIVALVVRGSLTWTAAGAVAGLAGALALSRYLRALLFGVGERDPLTLAGVALLLALVATLAAAIPAIRAVRADPMRALRQ